MDYNYLAHYGVLGMKWGVRRYQNKDGSLTAAGKKRSQEQALKDIKKYGRYTSDHTKITNSKNEELTQAIKRAKPFVDKLTSSGSKWGEIETAMMNMYDERSVLYRQNGTAERADKKAWKEARDAYGKQHDAAKAEYTQNRESYNKYLQDTVDKILGEYGDVVVRSRYDGRNSAKDALSDIMYWNNIKDK